MKVQFHSEEEDEKLESQIFIEHERDEISIYFGKDRSFENLFVSLDLSSSTLNVYGRTLAEIGWLMHEYENL